MLHDDACRTDHDHQSREAERGRQRQRGTRRRQGAGDGQEGPRRGSAVPTDAVAAGDGQDAALSEMSEGARKAVRPIHERILLPALPARPLARLPVVRAPACPHTRRMLRDTDPRAAAVYHRLIGAMPPCPNAWRRRHGYPLGYAPLPRPDCGGAIRRRAKRSSVGGSWPCATDGSLPNARSAPVPEHPAEPARHPRRCRRGSPRLRACGHRLLPWRLARQLLPGRAARHQRRRLRGRNVGAGRDPVHRSAGRRFPRGCTVPAPSGV